MQLIIRSNRASCLLKYMTKMGLQTPTQMDIVNIKNNQGIIKKKKNFCN